MKRQHWILLIIVISGLLLRLGLLTFIHNPGLNDQNHYYNLGHRLINGEGFTIDYVWHYSYIHDDIVHPVDHWMPLAGVAVAAGMSLFGENAQSALFLFIIAGTILPVVVYIAAKQYELSDSTALIAAAFAISIPDFVWNSLRTDTTILNMLLISASIIAFIHGVKYSRWWAYIVCGFLGGIAYLTRNDSIVILPLVIGSAVFYALWGANFTKRRNIWQIVLVFITFALTVSPWIMRNYQILGIAGSPESDRMFFMVDAKDHYAYNIPITFETMFERRSTGEHITKRLFELIAAFKQMIISLDVVLPLLVPLGLLYLISERNSTRIAVSLPTILWILGILVAYPLLLPYKSQSGSFEKAYLTIVPLLLPIAAIALDKLFAEDRWRNIAVILAVLLMTANSYDVLRLETQRADDFYANMQLTVNRINTLPDVTGDDEIRVMTQDPYVMSYYGISSVMTPLTTSREDVLEVAIQYNIDYLLMPAARPALDDLFQQNEIDERFVFVDSINNNARLLFEIYEIRPDEVADD